MANVGFVDGCARGRKKLDSMSKKLLISDYWSVPVPQAARYLAGTYKFEKVNPSVFTSLMDA